MVSYLKTAISYSFRKYGYNALLWNGVSVQVGSLIGALTVFPLVNVYNIFQEAAPCQKCWINLFFKMKKKIGIIYGLIFPLVCQLQYLFCTAPCFYSKLKEKVNISLNAFIENFLTWVMSVITSLCQINFKPEFKLEYKNISTSLIQWVNFFKTYQDRSVDDHLKQWIKIVSWRLEN